MTEFILAAIAHQPSSVNTKKALVSAECEARFESKILPRLTNRSAVFVEGHYRPYLIEPEFKEYSLCLTQLGGRFAEILKGIRPALGCFDPRWSGDYQKSLKIWNLEQAWLSSCVKIVDFNSLYSLSSFEELLERIRTGDFAIPMRRAPDPKEIEVARRVYGLNRRFNRSFIDAMRRYAPWYDTCVLVAGFSHCLSVALHTGWELVNLKGENREALEDMFIGYVGGEIMPRLLAEENTLNLFKDSK